MRSGGDEDLRVADSCAAHELETSAHAAVRVAVGVVVGVTVTVVDEGSRHEQALESR